MRVFRLLEINGNLILWNLWPICEIEALENKKSVGQPRIARFMFEIVWGKVEIVYKEHITFCRHWHGYRTHRTREGSFMNQYDRLIIPIKSIMTGKCHLPSSVSGTVRRATRVWSPPVSKICSHTIIHTTNRRQTFPVTKPVTSL